MWLGNASSAPTFIAVLSAMAAIGTFLAYVYFIQRSSANTAREEALALAETRREVIEDLTARLASYAQRARELETALEVARAEAREQAYQAQRLYTTGLAEVLDGVRHDLESAPPDVENALRQIRRQLAREQPEAPTERVPSVGDR
jgi:t-SNARE complex subunit (syntaxin)